MSLVRTAARMPGRWRLYLPHHRERFQVAPG